PTCSMPAWCSAPASHPSSAARCTTCAARPRASNARSKSTAAAPPMKTEAPMSDTRLQRIAVIGGVRIPFCRANGPYADASSLDMLSAALQGLSDRFGLAGTKIDEVVAGAVTSHSKDWNLAREALLSTDLSPLTPGITLQQACGTSLQAALMLAGKIATGQIECGIAAGTDTTSDAPIVFKRKFARRLIKLGQARTLKQRLQMLKGFS